MADLLLMLLLVVEVPVVWLILRKRLGGGTRRTVLKRIATPGAVYQVPIGNGISTWDPAHRPDRYDPPLIFGKGLATYWRDDEQRVHLLFQPEHGPEHHRVALLPGGLPAPHRWVARSALGALVVAGVGGFSVAYSLASGPGEERTVVGFLGIGAAWTGLSLLMLAFRVAQAIHAVVVGPGDPNRSARKAHPGPGLDPN